MSEEYHYVRTLGDDGGVEVCEGPAIGLDLESILKDGLPPWNVALEIVAGLCEILDIADEDGEVHGDLTPKDIFVDDTGAISVEGFHIERHRTRAPEGSPRGSATDLYGLGYVAFRLFCSAPLPALPNDDPDAHDDAIIDAILLVDLDGVPEEMQGDIQWFLAKLMSFDREDRPSAVEAWRTFIAFADATSGPDFVGWCTEAIEGGGERRKDHAGPKAPPAPAPTDEEELGGPVMRSGPLSKGAISFDAGGAPKGQATAFWSKDAMKAALEKAEVEDDDGFRPAAGGGSATAFWSKEELDAMRDGSSGAPRPKRSSKRSQTMMMAAPKKAGTSPSAPPQAPSASPPPVAPQSPPSPVQRQQPVQPAPPPQAGQPVIQGPVAGPPPAPPVEGGGKSGLLLGGAAVLVLVLVLGCLGVGGVGGVAMLLSGNKDQATVDVPPTPPPAPEPPVKDGEDTDSPEKVEGTASDPSKPAPNPAPKPAPKATPKPTPKTTSPKPAPASTTPRPRPRPAPAPAPTAATGGPAKVTFQSSGRGTVSCAGTNKEFDGPTSWTLEEYLLPVTCLVTIEGKRGVFQVYGTGRVTCNLAGGSVECDKMVVQ